MKRLFAFLILFAAAKAQVYSSVTVSAPGVWELNTTSSTVVYAYPLVGIPFEYWVMDGFVGSFSSASENEEQFVFELINRARANPAAEAARLELDLNAGLAPETISVVPKPPLAWNSSLDGVANTRATNLSYAGTGTSSGTVEKTLEERVTLGGYVLESPSACAENTGSLINDGNLDKVALAEGVYEQ